MADKKPHNEVHAEKKGGITVTVRVTVTVTEPSPSPSLLLGNADLYRVSQGAEQYADRTKGK
jgi:hypothetical protein